MSDSVLTKTVRVSGERSPFCDLFEAFECPSDCGRTLVQSRCASLWREACTEVFISSMAINHKIFLCLGMVIA